MSKVYGTGKVYRSSTHWTRRLTAWWQWWRPGVICIVITAGALSALQICNLLGII